MKKYLILLLLLPVLAGAQITITDSYPATTITSVKTFSANVILPMYEDYSDGSKKIKDLSGNNNYGISDLTPTFVDGHSSRAGKAISFNGSSDRITLINDIDLGNEITISMWVKYDNILGFPKIITDGELNILISADQLSIRVYSSTILDYALIPLGEYQEGIWNHLIITRDGSGYVSAWRNLAKLSLTDSTSGIPVDGSTIYIGNNSTNDREFSGSMSDFYIFDRILTEEEMSGVYYNDIDHRGKIIVKNTYAQGYAIGNSITYGHPFEIEYSYPAKLTELLNNEHVTIHNKGINSNTTTQMLARFETDVLNQKSPEYALILGGVNDIKTSNSKASTVTTNLQSMYTAAKNEGLIVVGITILPWAGITYQTHTPIMQTRTDSVNTWIMNDAVDIDYRVNAYDTFENPLNLDHLLPEYSYTDSIHLSKIGYEKLAETIYENVSW